MPEVTKKKGTPANETNSQKVVRLAGKRVNKAITQIRLIGNLGFYGPTEQQKQQIVKAIESEVAKMKQNIASATPVTEEFFKLG